MDDGIREAEITRQFNIGEVRYMAQPVLHTPYLDLSVDRISPVTVIFVSAQQRPSPEWATDLITEWLEHDDVFRPEFLPGVIFVTQEEQALILPEMENAMRRKWGTNWTTSIPIASLTPEIHSGPYVVWEGVLCQAFRLYDDPYNAFILAAKQPRSQSGLYQNLHISGDFYSSLSVAVPTRICCFDKDKPLSGLRFAVKDLFDVQGLRRTAGCRALYALSKAASSTAPVLQKLIDAGATLVGTLKLGSLITREEPTESVDYAAAFNPRADGYQSAWSSSGGSGAAIAAYDWLDFTLGTDTTGSSRRPALANGCFQIRVSQNKLPAEGILPSWTPFDAPAMFCRDIKKMQGWVSSWIDENSGTEDKRQKSIVYLKDFLPIPNESQMKLIDAFVADMESVLGIEKTEISIAELWKADPPCDIHEESIVDYLKDVGVNSFCYGVYHELDWFREDYSEQFSKAPYVNPVMSFRWEEAEKVTKDQHEDACHRLKVYKTWFLEKVMKEKEQNAMIVLPITSQEVDYRDVPPGSPTAPQAFDGIWLAPILGAPEVCIPIGEIGYDSRISKHREYLPVVVSLLGCPASDTILVDTISDILEGARRPTAVKTGSRMFSDT